jgi:hypothetical protein
MDRFFVSVFLYLYAIRLFEGDSQRESNNLIREGMKTVLSDENVFSLKQLSRYRTYLVGTASDFKRKIIAVSIGPKFLRKCFLSRSGH